MSSTFQPTPKAATLLQPIAPTSAARSLPTPAIRKFNPTCIPVSGDYQSKLTLMSESLRNDGRVWVPKRKEDCSKPPHEIPEEARDYYLERKYPSYGNLAPRDISSRSAKEACDEGRGADFLEFGELMCRDALDRNESCGGHFRTEYQTPDGEALRDDENYSYVSAWKFEGEGKNPPASRNPLSMNR